MGMVDSGSVFCQAVEETLRSLGGVESYVDDILIYRSTQTEHDQRLSLACTKLQDAGFRVNQKKVEICQKSLPMLGSILSVGPKGLTISVDPKKTEAIVKTPTPTTVTEVKSFLGACQYPHSHVSSFAQIAEPLNELTRKGIPFIWTEDCESAFQILKAKIINAAVLTPFDPTHPILLRTDASDYSLGAALSISIDGEE